MVSRAGLWCRMYCGGRTGMHHFPARLSGTWERPVGCGAWMMEVPCMAESVGGSLAS